MKNMVLQITLFCIIILSVGWSQSATTNIASGKEPQFSVSNTGIIRLVFGRSDSIFCSTSFDQGIHFSKPFLVGYIPGMHLGMSRGPQIASSENYSLITAMDKMGNIHFFQLAHATGKWINKGLVNDLPGSAPEGLMSIAADKNDNFYAVWLDIRQGKKNNICFSSLAAKQNTWKKNALVYISPDAHVCECCKPGITASGSTIVLMFRNWLNGSRDMYVMTSVNHGNTFSPPRRQGFGTWKLNGCPMDGGGLALNSKGIPETIWQREGKIYTAIPGMTETQIGEGRNGSIETNRGTTLYAWVNKGDIMVKKKSGPDINLGKGSMPSIKEVNNRLLCVWQNEGNIQRRLLTL